MHPSIHASIHPFALHCCLAICAARCSSLSPDLTSPAPSLLRVCRALPLCRSCRFCRHSPQGKQRYVAAIACLKRALYLDPFEWIISYNLGLVHLNTSQYASAFHYLSSSINLKPDFPSSYMYLAICLSRLDDVDNAIAAYEKACAMESDHLFHLNFAVTCWLQDRRDKARQQWALFQALWNEMGEEMRGADNEVVDTMVELERLIAQDDAKTAGAAAAGANQANGKLKPREKKQKAAAE